MFKENAVDMFIRYDVPGSAGDKYARDYIMQDPKEMKFRKVMFWRRSGVGGLDGTMWQPEPGNDWLSEYVETKESVVDGREITLISDASLKSYGFQAYRKGEWIRVVSESPIEMGKSTVAFTTRAISNLSDILPGLADGERKVYDVKSDGLVLENSVRPEERLVALDTQSN